MLLEQPQAASSNRLDHRAFYGLTRRPFDLTADPHWFLMTTGHREALSNLAYGVSEGTGITLLLGEAGTGKTSVLQRALTAPDTLQSGPIEAVEITNPTLTVTEFVETLAMGFPLPMVAESKPRLLQALQEHLIAARARGVTWILVVDEAQSLSDAVLEEVRLLANLEWQGDKLLRIILAGQPALGRRLNKPGLEQLKQRIALRCVLPPLSLKETARYIAHRLSLAGGLPAQVFTRDSVAAIHTHSRGIPRIINVICDNALLSGFAAGERPIQFETVRSVCADFDLQDLPSRAAPAASQAVAMATVPPRRGRGLFALSSFFGRRQ